MNKQLIALVVIIWTATIAVSMRADAGDVKYCKNYSSDSGEIVAVDAGMPCPWGTVEL